MGDDIRPDKIIEELGGCGRYQWRISIAVHVIKTVICFSVGTMVIISATPSWRCGDDVMCTNITSMHNTMNDSEVDTLCPKKSCFQRDGTTSCNTFVFEHEDVTKSIVTEFQLVCDRNYIPSMIMTIQLAGMLVGNLAAGQLGDLVGRKPPFFASIVLTLIFNVVGFFAVDWIMLAVARFFIGLASSFFLTTQYSLLSEFSLAKWRVWIVGFPSWPLQACLFVFLNWLIKDWRYIQLMIALLSVVFLFTWWMIPESFRWYIANDHPEKARKIILEVAKCNRKQLHKTDHLTEKPGDGRKYTLLDLLKNGSLRRIFFLLSLNWIAQGLVSYGIAFGVQALSGNLYFNLFLFNIVGIPSKAIALWLQNRFGRRATAVTCHLMVVIGGFVVGVVQSTDAPNKDALTNGFALLAMIGVTTNWGPVQTMTIENFPTVVRTVAFGTLSIFGRVAAMIGPQLVYADLFMPGVLYYVCGGISVICIVACYFLPETRGGDLKDKISETLGKVNPLENNSIV